MLPFERWLRFEELLDKVLKDPFGDYANELKLLAQSLPQTPYDAFYEEGPKILHNFVVDQPTGLITGVKSLFRKQELPPAFARKVANGVIRSGSFPFKGGFLGIKRAVILDGRFTEMDMFHEAEDVVVFGGVFTGAACFNESNSVICYGGQFSGGGAFWKAKSSRVLGGHFSGRKDFDNSVNTRVFGGQFTGRYQFSNAKKPLVLGGSWNTETGCFQNANDVRLWIPTRIENIDAPETGRFVAPEISTITDIDRLLPREKPLPRDKPDPKKAFYVTNCLGQHTDVFKPDVWKIPEQFLQLKEYKNIDSALRRLEGVARSCYFKAVKLIIIGEFGKYYCENLKEHARILKVAGLLKKNKKIEIIAQGEANAIKAFMLLCEQPDDDSKISEIEVHDTKWEEIEGFFVAEG